MGEKFLNWLEEFLPLLLSAALIFAAGMLLTKLIIKIMTKALHRSRLDETAYSFLISLVRTLLYIIVIIVSLSKLNVPMTSIIATLSAAGLAIGLALQNSLSNVAGGFIIMFSHPFRVGDFVEINGSTGTVHSISILYTRLLTLDNKAVMIPNGTVAGATIVNYTQEDYRRLDMYFCIDYAEDFHRAEDVIYEVIKNQPLALNVPEPPAVVMAEHAASSIKLLTKIWVKSADYWTLNYAMLADVKDAFDKAGIAIPFDQLDVHVYTSEE